MAQEKPGRDSTLALPSQWSTYYVVLLHKGPNYVENHISDSLKKLMKRHIQYQLRLQETGKAIAGGGFGQATDSTIGMTLLDVSSQEEAERLANADPAVKAGWYRVVLYPWYVPSRTFRIDRYSTANLGQ